MFTNTLSHHHIIDSTLDCINSTNENDITYTEKRKGWKITCFSLLFRHIITDYFLLRYMCVFHT